MYLLIRVVILVALFASVLVVFLNKKLRNRMIDKIKNYGPKRVKRGAIIFLVLLAVFVLAIFYPFESSFIRFDTVEQSVNYSSNIFDVVQRLNSEIYIAECDDTVFVVNEYGNTNSYTSIAKYGDGYGYCGHNVSIKLNTTPTFISTSKFEGAVSISAVYNKNTNKTCYIVSLFDAELYDDTKELYDQSEERMNVFVSEDGNILEEYYSIEEGAPLEKFAFVLDGEFFELDV